MDAELLLHVCYLCLCIYGINKTGFTRLLFIKCMYHVTKVSGIYLLMVSILSLSTTFLLDFGTVLTWYFSVFHFINSMISLID